MPEGEQALTSEQADKFQALVGLFLRFGFLVGLAVLVGALILTAGCGKQWLRLDQLTERVLTSCGGKCAPGTPERACLGALRATVAANLDAVPPSCAKWDKP